MSSLDHRIADGSSRAGVLRVLRDRGDLVRVEELADAVSLSLSAVRFHLERLIAEGLVRTAKEPRLTPGRPRVMYQAVPEEAVDDAAAYRRLASLLAAQLEGQGGVRAAEAAGRAWAQDVVEHPAPPSTMPPVGRPSGHGPSPIGLAGPDSLGDVLTVLEDGGFAPRVRDDGWTVELHRCPFEDLMVQQSEMICSVHRGLVRSIPQLSGDEDAAVLHPAPEVGTPCIVRFRRQ
jgi:predicted ArsR family transcriptional regulator